jgi:hypothetical protein
MKKLYLTDQQMEHCEVKEGDVIQMICPNEPIEIARILTFEEVFPPEPSPFAKCSRSKLF